MRFCSRHSTENVRLKKNIYVCGVVEDIVFVYRNVPDGSGIQTETKSLNVFEKQAVRDWGGGELSQQHGSQVKSQIIHYKREWLGCFSPATLEVKHGINQRVTEEINLSAFELGNTSSRMKKMLSKDDRNLKRKRSSVISNTVVGNSSTTKSFKQTCK